MSPEKVSSRSKSSVVFKLAPFLLAIGLIGAYVSHRNHAINQAFRRASGYEKVGTAESIAAVQSLASFRGEDSRKALLIVALGQGPLVLPDAQIESIKILRGTRDPGVAATLSSLLQPHISLPVHEAVAEALQSLPCDENCTLSIMRYLERIWHGELNADDTIDWPQGLEGASAATQREEAALYSALYSILRVNEISTLTAMAENYGLGTSAPSAFALDLAVRLNMVKACPSIMESSRLLIDTPVPRRGPKAELLKAIDNLKCK
jgi:hypothetical protein